MADDSNITITLAANTAGVQTALSEAIGSFQRMRQEMQYVSDASKTLGESVVSSNRSWLEAASGASDYQDRLTYLKETLAATQAQQQESVSALNQLTASMADERQELQYTREATQLLGAEQAELNMSWLLAADNTNEYAARLSYLREELALTREQQESLSADLNAGFGNAGGMGGGEGGFGFGGMLSSLSQIPILGNAMSMMTGMIGAQLFNSAYQGISSFFTQGLFGLNEQTQQNVNSWQYTYGMAPDEAAARGMTPAQRLAWNQQNAQDISKWSQDYSYSIPFTRQSLMTAISGAAPLGLDAAGLKHYFPIFADLAATHVNPMTGQPVDLGTVVQAIRGEEMGYSRMLKYDLNINTEDLVKYGLKGQGQGAGFKITDMTTLLPALEAYSKANGWTNMVNGQDQGVAFETAHSTWWGEWSSFLDRIQNLELGSGSKLFKDMQGSLNGISNWMDNHQGSLQHLADIIGGDVAGGFRSALSAVEGLGAGLHASGFDTQLLSGLQGLEAWFADPKHQQEIKDVAAAVGGALGGLGHGLGTVFGGLTDVWNAVSGSGFGQDTGGVLQWVAQNAWDPQWQRNVEMFDSLKNTMVDIFHGQGMLALYDLGGTVLNLDNVITFGLIPALNDAAKKYNDSKSGDQLKNPDPNAPSLGGVGAIVGSDAELAAVIQRMQWIQAHPSDPNDNIYQQQIQTLLQEYLQSQKTNDPKKQAAEQQILNDLQTLKLNPGNMLSITTALADIQKQLDILNGKNQGNGQGASNGQGAGQKPQGTGSHPQGVTFTNSGESSANVRAGQNFMDHLRGMAQEGIDAAKYANAHRPGWGFDMMHHLENFAQTAKNQAKFDTDNDIGANPVINAYNFAMGWAKWARIVAVSDQQRGLLPAGPDAAQNANSLMQALTGGLGGDKSHQIGSDFVQNLATGMQTKLPVISSTSQGIGTNIAQQIMQGAMQALGVGSGGAGAGGAGGISGIGPGSTLGDLVKWTVAEALQGMQGGVWGDGHTPGGFTHWGTYGFN